MSKPFKLSGGRPCGDHGCVVWDPAGCQASDGGRHCCGWREPLLQDRMAQRRLARKLAQRKYYLHVRHLPPDSAHHP